MLVLTSIVVLAGLTLVIGYVLLLNHRADANAAEARAKAVDKLAAHLAAGKSFGVERKVAKRSIKTMGIDFDPSADERSPSDTRRNVKQELKRVA